MLDFVHKIIFEKNLFSYLNYILILSFYKIYFNACIPIKNYICLT